MIVLVRGFCLLGAMSAFGTGPSILPKELLWYFNETTYILQVEALWYGIAYSLSLSLSRQSGVLFQ
jgi:hypothetical protein